MAVTTPSTARRARHLISIDDLTDDDLDGIVSRGAALARHGVGADRPLDGKVVGIYFRATSTRTRTAFSAGALRLGAQIIGYGPHDLQLNTGETTQDTGRVLAGMLDAIVARTTGDPAELRGWADQNSMAVVNAMSADEHPTQALADLTTMRTHLGRVAGLRVLYVGEGNNTAAALVLALSRHRDVAAELRTPPEHGLPEPVRARAAAQAARTGATIVEHHHMHDLPADRDVIYTTRWQTTGTSKARADWRELFAPFRVTSALWRDSPQALFMHDLPAHRGDEVTADVLDGPHSIAFAQAENKMHSAMAVLEWCLSHREDLTEGGPS